MCDSNKNTHTFEWLVENYIHGMAKYFDPKEIRSPLFTTDGATWYLAIRDVSDDFQDGAICSLGRYSGDKGADVVRIQWNLNVLESNNFSVLTEKESSVVDAYEKGYSRTACKIFKILHDLYLGNIHMNCYMIDYLPAKNPLFTNSKSQTKIDDFSWKPLNVLEMKLYSGSRGLQCEVSFHVSRDRVSIRIRRCDNKNLLKGYLMFNLSVTHGGVASAPCTRGEIGWSKPFDIDDTLEIPTIFSKNDFPQSKFINSVIVSGYFVTSIIEISDCSISKENIDRVIPALGLDSYSSDILKYDLLRMYENKIHTDVKLQIGSKTFPAHKCLLSSRSSVFSAMFENQTGIVKITDMDSNTLSLLLKYMYSGILDELHYKSALKLLLAAEKYQVLSLKEKCSSYLMANLSEENVCEVLATSDRISHHNLKSSSIEYVRSHAGSVLTSVSWKNLFVSNAKLVAEVLKIIFGICYNLKKIIW